MVKINLDKRVMKNLMAVNMAKQGRNTVSGYRTGTQQPPAILSPERCQTPSSCTDRQPGSWPWGDASADPQGFTERAGRLDASCFGFLAVGDGGDFSLSITKFANLSAITVADRSTGLGRVGSPVRSSQPQANDHDHQSHDHGADLLSAYAGHTAVESALTRVHGKRG